MMFLHYSYPVTLAVLCPLIFLAGFVDSVAGGGGLISLPAYIFAGLPIHVCYGTNKFVNGFGTLCASLNYFKNNCVNARAALFGTIGALIGSNFGARTALRLSSDALKICLLVILPVVVVFMIFNRRFGFEKEKAPIKRPIFSAGALFTGLIVGWYDGFFGPGTGMFLTLILAALLHMNLLTAGGTAKVINLASNIGSAAAFLAAGKVFFMVAIPCMLCSVGGNFLGSRLAIKNGAKIIRPVIVIVSVLLIAHIVSDFLKV
ncbi:sulfite exporter TauE/SafE family protein [Treponema parvum]|nr:TSUP family transporter [Treponema parvum]